MKKKNWFVLLGTVLAGCIIVGVSCLPHGHPPNQVTVPSETAEQREVSFDVTPALAENQSITFGYLPPDMRVNRWTSISPDGQWIAEGIVAFPKEEIGGQKYYTGLVVQTVDGKTRWAIIDEWAEVGLGWPFPQPFHWSRDGRSFYYTHRVVPDGCGGAFVYGWGLQKVDLDSGTVTELLPPESMSVALSPDEATVAYIGRSGLVLHDLASGQEREVSIDPGKSFDAKIVWSPDSKSLAITLAIAACNRVEDGESTSILLVDRVSLAVRTALSEDKRYLVAEEWIQPHQIALKDPQGSKWILDVKSGEIAQQ